MSMREKIRLAAMAALVSAALVALPAYGASASTESAARDGAPDCATTWTGHDYNKWVKVRNDCGHTIRVKIVIQYNFDSECKVLKPHKTFLFRHGWGSYLDEVRAC
ncbi:MULTISPECIES: hypothetical protein [unclassified Nonomuraea]|uniref:hypothetical protein n=1 Tax=unclassified Nonomuraea TaxID=2593643 RepID=UPI0033D67805